MNLEQTWSVALGLLGALLCGASSPISAVIMAEMLNALAPGSTTSKSLWASMFFVLAFAELIGWGLQGFFGVAGEALTEKLRRMLFTNLLRQDQAFFDTPGREVGALTAVLSGDAEAVHQMFGPSLALRIQMSFSLLAGLAIGLYYQWKLALVTFVAVPLMVLATFVTQVLLLGNGSVGLTNEDDTLVVECLGQTRTVVAFNVVARLICFL